MSLSYPALYPRVKKVIAERKNNLSPHDIRASFKLSDPPLRFTATGKVALKGYLEEEFSTEGLQISEAELEAAKTVQDIAKKIFEKVGS